MSNDESSSELSDPDSNITTFDNLQGETVVDERNSRKTPKMSCGRLSFQGNHNMEKVMDEMPGDSAGSHSPKRKRTSIVNDLSESNLQSAHTTAPKRSPTSPASTNKLNPNYQSLGGPGVKDVQLGGVLLGTWRDSGVSDVEKKHAVIGFIDVSDRLRTYIQPNTKHGEPLAEDYPLPPGPCGSWVAFERVIFSDHLVGLNHSQVKEYTRLRSEAAGEETEDDRVAIEHAAVQEAIHRVKENPAFANPAQPPVIAYGVDMPEYQVPVGAGLKRRCARSGFAAINTAHPEPAQGPGAIPAPENQQTRFLRDLLPGTRPTGILIGYWKQSSEVDPRDRHAVYGVLGRNDKFRIKVVRHTRDGRFMDGNYPSGTGALWIPYEEVEFEQHLRALTRQEVKEYCRARQYQLDHGETLAERIENESKAVYEAQIRADNMTYKQPHSATVSVFTASSHRDSNELLNEHYHPSHELRQSLQTEPRSIQATLGGDEQHPSQPLSVGDDMARSRAVARREIATAEAAQNRADYHIAHRERGVVAAAVDAANAAAVASSAPSRMSLEHHHNTNNRMLFQTSEAMQRLNGVWVRQETLRRSSPDRVKMYDGDKYERKATGPFMGKLVSQGRIINIDGDDYIEYRVLTKPSFF